MLLGISFGSQGSIYSHNFFKNFSYLESLSAHMGLTQDICTQDQKFIYFYLSGQLFC